MQNLFDAADRNAIVGRLAGLQPSSPRQWGRMNIAQMLAHCALELEIPCGDRVQVQGLPGRVLAPLVRPRVLGPKPFFRNAPADPDLKVVDQRDFDTEKARLSALIDRFCSRERALVEGVVHSFFGPLTADQWARLTYKHLDHHLRQFGA